MNEVFVRVIDFPNTSAKGTVIPDENGDYNVYLNARYNLEQNLMTYVHENIHIRYGHLESGRPVEDVEEETKRAQQLVARGL